MNEETMSAETVEITDADRLAGAENATATALFVIDHPRTVQVSAPTYRAFPSPYQAPNPALERAGEKLQNIRTLVIPEQTSAAMAVLLGDLALKVDPDALDEAAKRELELWRAVKKILDKIIEEIDN